MIPGVHEIEMEDKMADMYNHHTVEKKWQKIWDDEKAFKTENDYTKPKFYALVEFPYPSGQGLHVGHPRPYTALDIVARKRRMQGYNVLYPMGWDAFGLPTENYAIKNKVHPKEVTKKNVARFKEQLHSLGYSFDWDREINTTDPDYYKWTQWIFLKLFNAGLAYKKEMPINWCTSCKVGLANEEVVNGVCERCGSPVVRKVKSEWMLKITNYADKLLEGLNDVDYIERVKTSQRNWIGRSEGAEVDFRIKDKEDKLRVYTTRPDTLFGATYMVVSPEHPIIDKYKDKIKNWDGNGKDGKLNIYLDEDALLVNRLQECTQAMEPAIGIWDSSNITISGRGIIDGQGTYGYTWDQAHARLSGHQGGSMVVRSQDITFNDTYVRDVKQWNWECHTVKDITYNNIKGLSPFQHSWVDGLDLTSGQGITVNGAITMGNDDTFASGHYNPSNEFPERQLWGKDLNNLSAEDQNIAAAAAIYNKDRLNWDTDDTTDVNINDTLG